VSYANPRLDRVHARTICFFSKSGECFHSAQDYSQNRSRLDLRRKENPMTAPLLTPVVRMTRRSMISRARFSCHLGAAGGCYLLWA
jgi:hypothetical protein